MNQIWTCQLQLMTVAFRVTDGGLGLTRRPVRRSALACGEGLKFLSAPCAVRALASVAGGCPGPGACFARTRRVSRLKCSLNVTRK
jgi:hypothetical protein